MTPAVRIRPFVLADAPALAALFHAAVRSVRPPSYSPAQIEAWSPSPPPAQAFIDRAATHRVLVATDDEDVPIGFATLEPDGHFDHLYRHPDYAGRRVGRALIAAIEALARQCGMRALFAEASEAAWPVFERAGWHRGRRAEVMLGAVVIHHYRMTRTLSPD